MYLHTYVWSSAESCMFCTFISKIRPLITNLSCWIIWLLFIFIKICIAAFRKGLCVSIFVMWRRWAVCWHMFKGWVSLHTFLPWCGIPTFCNLSCLWLVYASAMLVYAILLFMYRKRAIIGRSWLEAALEYKPYIRPKVTVHKWSLKMG